MIILITLESQNRQACYYWHQLPLMGPAYWRPLLVSTAPPQDHTFEENTQREKHTVPPQDHRCFNFPLPLVCVPHGPPPPFSMEDPFKIDKKCHKIEGGVESLFGQWGWASLRTNNITSASSFSVLSQCSACLPACSMGGSMSDNALHNMHCTALH